MTATLPSLDAIQARADAATEGPWWTTSALRPPSVFSGGGSASDVGVLEAFEPADAEFIAHARTDVPVLVAALRAVLDVADQLDRLAARHPDSETGQVETAAAHEIRRAITAHIDTTTKETSR